MQAAAGLRPGDLDRGAYGGFEKICPWYCPITDGPRAAHARLLKHSGKPWGRCEYPMFRKGRRVSECSAWGCLLSKKPLTWPDSPTYPCRGRPMKALYLAKASGRDQVVIFRCRSQQANSAES